MTSAPQAQQFFRVYIRVLRLLGAESQLATVLVFSNLGIAAAQFAEPILFGRIIDRLAQAQTAGQMVTWPELVPLVSAWVAFGLFTIAGGVLVALHADRLSHRRRLAIMAEYFEHVMHLPLGFHTASHSGRLLKTMLDGASSMASVWLNFFREHCASFVALFVLLPLSISINWRLATLLILLVGLFGVLTAFVMRKTEGLQSKVEKIQDHLTEHAADALGNVAVIQSFTRVEAESRALRKVSADLLQAQIPVLSWWAIAAMATRASATLTLFGIFILGTALHLRGQATIGEIVTFMSFATMLIGRLEHVVSFVNWILQIVPRLQIFFDIFDTQPSVRDAIDAVDPGRLKGKVIFDHVYFSYNNQREAVADVNFTVEAGQTVAFVGATGSGKSTTLGLLHRVFDPQKGTISIDGIDIRKMTLAGLRRNIGVVFQEPMLFARSIEENLRIGKADATMEEITLALERAQATAFVQNQSAGLQTVVSERGRSLSGGERQRLSIARALLKDPPILVFDEATSALDAATEQQLQLALASATQGRTTFVIAHRLATIRSADRILVLDQGKIVESGSYAELVAQNGRFAQLARAQFMDTLT